MQLHSPLHHWRHRARSSQEETRFLRIESPSIATAKDYYNHQYAHLLGGTGDLGNGSWRAPKLRAIIARHPRRHSSPVRHVQHAPIASSVVRYGGDEIGGAESGEIEKGVLTGGKRKSRDFLLSSPPTSPQPIHTTQLPFNPTHENSPSPSISVSPASYTPPTLLHLPITSTPPPRRVPATKIHNPLHPQSLGYIPFEYTLRKLQDWGTVYLYNTATADVFVRGMPLCTSQGGEAGDKKLSDSRGCSEEKERGIGEEMDGVEESLKGGMPSRAKGEDGDVAQIRMSLKGAKLEDANDQMKTGDSMEIGDSITVRTPVAMLLLPSNRISIQRKGSRDETTGNVFVSPPPSAPVGGAMRNVKVRIRVIPPPSCSPPPSPSSKAIPLRDPIIIEKSFPIPISLLSQHPPRYVNIPSACSSSSPYSVPSPAPALPLHIEYAIYRAPLLGAILLSEFVQRGDTVEVPVPWPEVWEETIMGIYLGDGLAGLDGERVEKVRGNLEFLGCRDLRA